MADEPTIDRHAKEQRIDDHDFEKALRLSGSLLAAQSALARVIADKAVLRTSHDATTLDLLVRLQLSPQHQLRGVELCRQLDLSKSHVSRVIDGAERDGLVQRQPDPQDRRAQQITLTGKGEEAVQDFAPHLLDVLDKTVNGILTQEEGATLMELHARIAESANGLRDQQEPNSPVAQRKGAAMSSVVKPVRSELR